MTYEKSHILKILLLLGKEGALFEEKVLTTSFFAKKLGISQQTSSRWLEDSSLRGYIEKKQSGQGLSLMITMRGFDLLKQLYSDLQYIFSDIPKQIRGQVSTGLGEGGYYISLPGYMTQFTEILGWVPFAGTLNLKLITEEDREAFDLLSKSHFTLVEGFFDKEMNRHMGKVFVYKCIIKYTDKQTSGAIIIPDRTHHSDVMELLAQEHLREIWDLHDGDTLVIVPKLFD